MPIQKKAKKCPYCKVQIYYKSRSCRRCSPKTPEHIEAIKAKNAAKGGHHMTTKKGKEDFKKRMLEIHGVEWAGQSKVLREKAEDTFESKEGVRHWAHTERGKKRIHEVNNDPETIVRKVGKWRATQQKEHGDDWRVWNQERLAKARYRFTDLTVEGKVYTCQGYEPVALVWLHRKGLDISKAKLSKTAFPYTRPDGKRAVYLPDIVFPDGFVIEVKSSYTAGLGDNGAAPAMWKQLQTKSKAVNNAGRNLDLLVCSGKRVLLRIRNPHTVSRTKALRLYSDAVTRLD